MKKGKGKIKELPRTRIRPRSTRGSTINKKINQKEPNPWTEIRLKLQPLIKVYSDYRERRKIVKEKEKQRRLQEQEEQRFEEEEEQRLKDQEEKKLKKEKRLKEQEEIKLRKEEEKRLKEKKIKEDQEERKKQARIYKERLARGEQERLAQLAKVRQSKEEEKQLIEERNLMRERKLEKEKKLEKERKLKKEQKLKDQEEKKLKNEPKLKEKEEQRLKGKVKWFNGTKGYGFIEREDKKKDVFVHSASVRNAGLNYLNKGDQLTFEVENTDKGLSAINLQKTT